MPKKMLRFARFAAVLATLTLSFLTCKSLTLAEENDVDAVLQKVYSTWSKVSTWQADFVQSSLYQGTRVRKRGHVVNSTQDGKTALHYTLPQEALAAISGDHAVAYYPSRKEAARLVSPLIENLPRLLQAGQPPEVLKLAYDVQWTEPRNPNFYSLEFTPRIPFPVAPMVTKLRFEYDKTSFLPMSSWIFDKDGNWVRLEYRRALVNAKLDPSVFEVKLPAGTKINDAPDLNGVMAELLGLTTPEAKKP
jgi:outer membrane lipoprotein-sorting protein